MLDFLEDTPLFIEARRSNEFHSNGTHIIGFPFDGTTSFRPGARLGPEHVRMASVGIENYSPYLDKELTEKNIFDLGNIPFHPSRFDIMCDYYIKATNELKLKEDKIRIVTFGGEHSISIEPLKLHLKNYPNMVVLHLDAHADLRDGYLGAKHSHASIIRRLWDHLSTDNEVLQYGIRSGTREEFEFMKQKGTLLTSLDNLVDNLKAIPDSRPIYMTLDLDFFDPAYFPGTGTPEAGGESFHSFIKILKVLAHKNFIGADITELAPMIDSTGNSSVFAAKTLREVLLALK